MMVETLFLLVPVHSKATNVLELLTKVAVYAVNLTGIFSCKVSSISRIEGSLISSYFG